MTRDLADVHTGAGSTRALQRLRRLARRKRYLVLTQRAAAALLAIFVALMIGFGVGAESPVATGGIILALCYVLIEGARSIARCSEEAARVAVYDGAGPDAIAALLEATRMAEMDQEMVAAALVRLLASFQASDGRH